MDRELCKCPVLRAAAEINRLAMHGIRVPKYGERLEPLIIASLREQYGCLGSDQHGYCPWMGAIMGAAHLTPDEDVPVIGARKNTGEYL